jgi:hypothetical protein
MRICISTLNKTVVNQFTSPFFTVFSSLFIGPIPPEIFKLTNLRELRMSYNDELTGQYFNYLPNDLEGVSLRQIRPWWTSSPCPFCCCIVLICMVLQAKRGWKSTFQSARSIFRLSYNGQKVNDLQFFVYELVRVGMVHGRIFLEQVQDPLS